MGAEGAGRAIEGAIIALQCLAALSLVAIPLAIWKLIDIAIWIWSHLNVAWN